MMCRKLYADVFCFDSLRKKSFFDQNKNMLYGYKTLYYRVSIWANPESGVRIPVTFCPKMKFAWEIVRS